MIAIRQGFFNIFEKTAAGPWVRKLAADIYGTGAVMFQSRTGRIWIFYCVYNNTLFRNQLWGRYTDTEFQSLTAPPMPPLTAPVLLKTGPDIIEGSIGAIETATGKIILTYSVSVAVPPSFVAVHILSSEDGGQTWIDEGRITV